MRPRVERHLVRLESSLQQIEEATDIKAATYVNSTAHAHCTLLNTIQTSLVRHHMMIQMCLSS